MEWTCIWKKAKKDYIIIKEWDLFVDKKENKELWVSCSNMKEEMKRNSGV